jgi:hypothetical protein
MDDGEPVELKHDINPQDLRRNATQSEGEVRWEKSSLRDARLLP